MTAEENSLPEEEEEFTPETCPIFFKEIVREVEKMEDTPDETISEREEYSRPKRGRRPKFDTPEKLAPVAKYRSALGLTQAEMATLLRTTPSTLNLWERDVDEELAEKRGASYFIFECVKALISQSFVTPDMIDPADLKKFIRAGAQKGLAKHYVSESRLFDDGFLRIIDSGNFIGVLFAMLADEFFRKSGQPAPGDRMLKMREIADIPLKQDDEEEEENLDRLSFL